MSTALIQRPETVEIANRPFCSAIPFVASKRPTEEKATQEKSTKSIAPHQEKEGVWFCHKSTTLWYPYDVKWIRDPGSINNLLTYPTSTLAFGPGLGLRNRRNACFLNAVIQALTYLPPLFASAYKGSHSKHCRRAASGKALYCGYCEFEAHIKRVTNARGRFSGKHRSGTDIKFYQTLHNEMLNKYNVSTSRQACAYEALTMTLEWLRMYDLPPSYETAFTHHKLPMPQLNTAFLGQVLGSVIQHRRTCLNCFDEGIVHEVVNDHVLSLNGAKTLEAALAKHFAPEELDEANKSDCDKCKSKQKKRLERRILVPPNVLVIVVRRSLWSGPVSPSHRPSFLGLTKDNRTLQAPTILDLSPYLQFASPRKEQSKPLSGGGSYSQLTDHKYQITGAVVHHGVPMVGHYVAICRSPNGQYYKYNDECVTPINGDERLSRELSKAYIYFYTRVSGGTPMPEEVARIKDSALAAVNKAVGISDQARKKLSLIMSVKPADGLLSSAATTVTRDDDGKSSTCEGASSAEDEDEARSSSSNKSSTAGRSSASGSTKSRESRLGWLRLNPISCMKQIQNNDDDDDDETMESPVHKSSKWDDETLQSTGADLNAFMKHPLKKPSVKELPGNKRSQSDLDYDRGRIKKKKPRIGKPNDKSPTRTVVTPSGRTFDQRQRDFF
eukprot:Blabericola_migrator_1__738@NODE_1184_length_5189_cov_182_323702_g63_i1_p1_GENE_NODE_1184_length_5189_cov_182_323702_g63_i1NODE_1184_length_5189_cov_182_323702_g63_i1_p1_ORF_typecomplete_len670_score95_44UCH/PF00443_29/6_1e41UCH_1/PF13423_6/2_1e12OSD/PF03392_13/0_085_NODE_1184_length_5189_cov_182_323702_g63_i125744583